MLSQKIFVLHTVYWVSTYTYYREAKITALHLNKIIFQSPDFAILWRPLLMFSKKLCCARHARGYIKLHSDFSVFELIVVMKNWRKKQLFHIQAFQTLGKVHINECSTISAVAPKNMNINIQDIYSCEFTPLVSHKT